MPIFDQPLDALRRRTSIKWTRFEPDVLPMFVAEMDCALPPAVVERLERAVRDGDTGYPEQPFYEESFAAYAHDRWGWSPEPGWMSLAGDVMSGMREVLTAVTRPGDAVVINPPIYPPFRQIVAGAGRRIVEVPMSTEGRLDLDGLAAAFADRPAAYLLCNPHNPNGTVHTRDELARVAELADEFGVRVLSDEVHGPLVGAAHVPYLSVPGSESGLVITSGAKSFNLAGIKAGLIIPGERARDVVGGLPVWVHEAASHLAVLAHSAGFDHERAWLSELSDEISANKQHLADELARVLPELCYRPSEGTYLAWVDCTPLGLENPGRHFHEVGRVRFNMGSDFAPSAGQFVRINVAASREVISEGVRRMGESVGQR